jgi:hypothetical protein
MPLKGPIALNAGTTYGVDTSAANNYGLGSSFKSTSTLKRQQTAKAAAPSLIWIILFVVAVVVL